MPNLIGQTTDSGVAGVFGESQSGNGVQGSSKQSDGVAGVTTGDGKAGIAGFCDNGNGNGVYGRSNSVNHSGVSGLNTAGGSGVYGLSDSGTGVYGGSKTGYAGFFSGNVSITGDLTAKGDVICSGADCAEDFDVSTTEDIAPGTVMTLNNDGDLCQCHQAYDKRVTGVVSGAGSYRPAIILDKQAEKSNRRPIALVGKVYCKVDANYASIEVGDLLTTSDTLGHAMKASDQLKAFGSVIGKALRPLKEGQGLIPILIALQ